MNGKSIPPASAGAPAADAAEIQCERLEGRSDLQHLGGCKAFTPVVRFLLWGFRNSTDAGSSNDIGKL